jgi:hypothetical protein
MLSDLLVSDAARNVTQTAIVNKLTTNEANSLLSRIKLIDKAAVVDLSEIV